MLTCNRNAGFSRVLVILAFHLIISAFCQNRVQSLIRDRYFRHKFRAVIYQTTSVNYRLNGLILYVLRQYLNREDPFLLRAACRIDSGNRCPVFCHIAHIRVRILPFPAVREICLIF